MTKRSSTLVALLCAAAFFAGCASESPTGATDDTVAPAAVLDLDWRVVDGGIDVTWSAGGEADLAGYRVYRSTNGASAVSLAEQSGTTFRDVNVVYGSSYRYEVSVVDQSGNESARAATIAVSLRPATSGRGPDLGD